MEYIYRKSCFHLYCCMGFIFHSHVGSLVAPSCQYTPVERTHTHMVAHIGTQEAQLFLINKLVVLLVDATVAIDSELAVRVMGCLSNNQGCISISQLTEQPA